MKYDKSELEDDALTVNITIFILLNSYGVRECLRLANLANNNLEFQFEAKLFIISLFFRYKIRVRSISLSPPVSAPRFVLSK